MGYGVCNCVGGPPPGGRCTACGMIGPASPWDPPVVPVLPPVVSVPPDELRRLIREELERFHKDLEKLAGK